MSRKILAASGLIALIAAAGGGVYTYMKTKQESAVDPAGQTAPGAIAPQAGTPPSQTQAAVPSSPESAASPVPAPSPDLTVDASGLSKATVLIQTSRGDIRFKFYPNDAPNTVQRIIQLIQKGFYDGLVFHRVVPGFVVQGGDPEGNGTGGSGVRLKAEFNERKHIEGTVAMARAADPDSADSQFYIALGPQPHLDRSYTVFGQVVSGMDVIHKIGVGDKMLKLRIE